MSNLIIYDTEIRKENFTRAKNKLGEYSILVDKNVDIGKVKTSWLGVFNKNVTAKELNEITEQVQKKLIALNDLSGRMIDALREAYGSIENLDKEYMNSVLMALKSAEKVDEGLKKEQKEISKIIRAQEDTIRGLATFDEQVKVQFNELEKKMNDLTQCLTLVSSKQSQTIERQMRTIADLETFDKVVDEQFEYIENSFVTLSKKIEKMDNACNEWRSKIIDMESRLEKLQEHNNKDNRAFTMASAAIIGVVVEALIIFTMLY